MPSALMRRSAWSAAVVTVVAIASPLISHASAAAAPQFDSANSTPGPGQSVIAGSETLTAAFDQPVTGDQNSFKVFEVDTNGTRGQQLPGTVTFDPGMPPITGPGDTVTWKPSFTLIKGEYEAVLSVNGFDSGGNKDPNSVGTADYDFYVAGTGAPTGLQGPPWVNNQNFQAVPFSGVAAPGLTITVTVNGNDATTGSLPQSAMGSGVVPTCNTAPACPWTVNVDMSDDNPAGPSPSFADSTDGSMTWTAQGTEPESSSIKTAVSAPVPQKQDTMAPATPTAQTPTISADSTTVKVPGATDSASDVVGYTISVTDPQSHSVTVTPSAGSDSNHTMAQQLIDVTSLDDGTLKVHIDARDAAGNLSGDFGGNSPPTVTKSVGTIPNLTTSTFTTPAGDTTFADAATHAIQVPSKLDIEFTEPITASYTDNSDPVKPVTHDSSACIASTSGNCLVPLSLAASPSGNGLIATPPKGTTLAQDAYTIHVVTYPSSTCGNVNPGGTDHCVPFNDFVRNGSTAADYASGTQTPKLTWTVDTTPPTISITHLDNPITASNYSTAGVAGTVDTDVSAVQLTIVSSHAPSHPHIATAHVTNGNWDLFPMPLAGVVDGTLSIAFKATDAAGLSTTVSRQVSLNALNFHVIPGDKKILVTWAKPALANKATPTYTLTYKDQSVANSATQTLHPSASATSTLLTGLVNGHNYGVTMTATDPNGDGPTAVGAATPKTATTVTLLTSASTVTYGTAIRVSGRLTDASGHGLASRTLTVYPVYAGNVRGTVSHPKTDANGNWTLRSVPARNASYRVGFAGDAGNGASSNRRSVVVRVAIRITSVSAKSSSHTTAVRIAGTVAPNEHGRRVNLYEVRSGRSVLVATLTLSSTSTFSYTHVWSRGTHVVFVTFASQNGITGASSAKVKFSRT